MKKPKGDCDFICTRFLNIGKWSESMKKPKGDCDFTEITYMATSLLAVRKYEEAERRL